MNGQQDRAAFEAWAQTTCANLQRTPDDGAYHSSAVAFAWRAFLAGEALGRERIRALVEAVRDANRDAESGGTFRLLTPGQECAWMALLAGLEGPSVEVIGKPPCGAAGAR